MTHSLNASFDKTKTLAVGAILIAGFAWLGWMVIGRVVSGIPLISPLWLNTTLLLVFGITSVCMLVSISWHLYRGWKTEISEVGISQPQIRGLVQVHWHEFTNARVTPQFRIDLHYPGGKVVVAAGMYVQPESVVAFVSSKVSRVQSSSN